MVVKKDAKETKPEHGEKHRNPEVEGEEGRPDDHKHESIP